jgi:hypothetical protein
VQGPLADAKVIALLKERFVCVQEIIPGAETRPEDLPAERRRWLAPFARNGRFFFGTIRLLAPDGKEVLASLRSFPGADEETRKQEGAKFLALAQEILKRQPAASEEPQKEPPAKPKPKLKDGLGPKQGGPAVGSKAPDFELKHLAAEETFKLSDNFGKRPTVLIFHSFT